MCHAQLSVYNWTDTPSEAQAKALSLAERAAELSADDPIILAILGTIHTFARHYGTARVLLDRALAIDSNAAWAWSRLGWLQNYVDQPETAIGHFERALRLSPLDPMNFNNYVGMAASYYVLQQHEKAVALYRRALEERPNAKWIYRDLAGSLVGAGRRDEARQAYDELMCSYPDLTVTKVKRAMVFSDVVLERMAQNLRELGLPD